MVVEVKKMNVNEINAAVLAYIGDAVYEQKVREYLIYKKINKVNELQKEAVKYVSANSQAQILDKLLLRQILTEEELYTISRSKNYKPASKPKHASVVTYKKATALEALFGMLYIKENINSKTYLITLFFIFSCFNFL